MVTSETLDRFVISLISNFLIGNHNFLVKIIVFYHASYFLILKCRLDKEIIEIKNSYYVNAIYKLKSVKKT
jgi:hypothetical protein